MHDVFAIGFATGSEIATGRVPSGKLENLTFSTWAVWIYLLIRYVPILDTAHTGIGRGRNFEIKHRIVGGDLETQHYVVFGNGFDGFSPACAARGKPVCAVSRKGTSIVMDFSILLGRSRFIY